MAFVPPEGDCLRAALPRLELLYDLPLLLSSAVAQPLAALLPYGCGTPLAGAALESERKCSVITCCRWHNIAASAAKPPRQTIASLYKSKVGGNCVRLPNRRQSDSEDRSKPSRLDTTPSRHLIPQAAQLFKCQSANAKPFSWGSKGAILFCEREWPLCPVPLRNAGETRSPRSGNAVFTSCAPPISGIVPRSFFGYFRSRGFLPPACRGRSSSCRV